MNIDLSIIEKHEPILTTDKNYICLYGGRGSAKSNTFARYCIAESFQPDSNILCTREVQKSIDESVYAVLESTIKKAKITEYFKFAKTYIQNVYSGNDFVFAGLKDHTVDSIKSYEKRRICWVEEAQSASQRSLDVLIPTIIRNKNFKLLFSYNRYTDLDAVHALTKRDDVLSIYTTVYDNPFVEDEMLIEAERMKIEDYGKWLHIYMGEPINQTEKSILTRIDVNKAVEREIEAEGAIEVGADIARFGADSTVLCKRKGLKLLEKKIFNGLSTTEVVWQIIDFVNQNKKTLIKVDDTGVGGGVTDQLKNLGYNVIGLNFGARAKDRDKYNNLISEAWFEFKDIINEVQLINDEALMNELTTREWKIDSKGRRCVESKEDYKKRGYASPDSADSLLICFYNSTNVFNDKFDLTTGLTKESFY